MAYDGKYTSKQIDALLDALTAGTAGYYTSKYGGEEMDALLDKGAASNVSLAAARRMSHYPKRCSSLKPALRRWRERLQCELS